MCTEVNPRLTIRRARFSGALLAGCLAGDRNDRTSVQLDSWSLPCCCCIQQVLNARTHPHPNFPIAALIYADVARAINNLALPNEHEAKAVDARQVGTAMLAAVAF